MIVTEGSLKEQEMTEMTVEEPEEMKEKNILP